jgi:hypothetical protein
VVIVSVAIAVEAQPDLEILLDSKTSIPWTSTTTTRRIVNVSILQKPDLSATSDLTMQLNIRIDNCIMAIAQSQGQSDDSEGYRTLLNLSTPERTHTK